MQPALAILQPRRVLKVYARADVVRDDPHALAELRPRRAARDVDLAVLFGEARDARVGKADDATEAAVLRVATD